jgi:hypothetical protein
MLKSGQSVSAVSSYILPRCISNLTAYGTLSFSWFCMEYVANSGSVFLQAEEVLVFLQDIVFGDIIFDGSFL